MEKMIARNGKGAAKGRAKILLLDYLHVCKHFKLFESLYKIIFESTGLNTMFTIMSYQTH